MKIMKEKIMKYMFYYIIISRQNQRKTPTGMPHFRGVCA